MHESMYIVRMSVKRVFQVQNAQSKGTRQAHENGCAPCACM
jgi:hypothetical protein